MLQENQRGIPCFGQPQKGSTVEHYAKLLCAAARRHGTFLAVTAYLGKTGFLATAMTKSTVQTLMSGKKSIWNRKLGSGVPSDFKV